MNMLAKFRGKSLSTGEWVYGWYIREARGLINGLPAINLSQAEIVSFIVYSEEGQLIIHEVDPNTVGQYTGLKDKNANEIYKDDMLKDKLGTGKVIWMAPSFVVVDFDGNLGGGKTYPEGQQMQEAEIIGSTHDNPDLLTQ